MCVGVCVLCVSWRVREGVTKREWHKRGERGHAMRQATGRIEVSPVLNDFLARAHLHREEDGAQHFPLLLPSSCLSVSAQEKASVASEKL